MKRNKAMHTKYLILQTRLLDLRDAVTSADCEDTMRIIAHKPIGESPSAEGDFSYATVLHALASGWRLMSQPQETLAHRTVMVTEVVYTWWLTNDGGPVLPPMKV